MRGGDRRHLALTPTDEAAIPYVAAIPQHAAANFAALAAEAELYGWDFQKSWLKHLAMYSGSEGGKRAAQLVEVLRAERPHSYVEQERTVARVENERRLA